MKETIIFSFLILITLSSCGQSYISYTDDNNEKHLSGTFPLEKLEQDEVYKKWFNNGYSDFKLNNKEKKWKKNLNLVNVEIFLGTWCPDSHYWVPRFVKLWDQLGLKRAQLTFIAVYGSSMGEKYKKSVNGEEKYKNIKNVPTFIINYNEKEVGRIIESPTEDLETDLSKIAQKIVI